MVKRALGKRNFPGRLTLEEWLTVPYRERIDLIWRAVRSVGIVPVLRRKSVPTRANTLRR
jgi:hypothetical protein